MKKLLLSLVLFTSFNLTAQNCSLFFDWQYEQTIIISNLSITDTIFDTQFKVYLNTENLIVNGKLQSNGEDIRFIDASCNILHHWVEDDLLSTNTGIWVKVDTIPANELIEFKFIYGNNMATTTNSGDSTFLFFDDFDSGSLSNWTTFNNGVATTQILTGKLLMNTSSPDVYTCLYSNISFGPGVALHYHEENTLGNRYHVSNGFGWDPNRTRTAGGYFPAESVGEFYAHDGLLGEFFTSIGDAEQFALQPSLLPGSKNVEIRYFADSASLYANEILLSSTSLSIPSDSLPVFFWQNGWDGVNSTWVYDTVFVRKLNAISSTAINYFSESLLTFCTSNPITTQPTDQTVNISNNATFNFSDSLTAATYQWQMDAGTGYSDLSNAGQFSGADTDSLIISTTTMGNNNTNYRCLVTESASCMDTTDVVLLTVINDASIGELNNSLVKLYPNPSNAIITLTLAQHSNVQIILTDILGKELLSKSFTSNEVQLNLKSLASKGTYFAKIIDVDGNVIAIKKLIYQ